MIISHKCSPTDTATFPLWSIVVDDFGNKLFLRAPHWESDSSVDEVIVSTNTIYHLYRNGYCNIEPDGE